MEKTATLNLRINPDVKKSAEIVLSQLGVPMATAIDMLFLIWLHIQVNMSNLKIGYKVVW